MLTDRGSIWFDSYPDLFNIIRTRELDLRSLALKSEIFSYSKPVFSIAKRCDAHPKVSKNYLVLDSYSKSGRVINVFKH